MTHFVDILRRHSDADHLQLPCSPVEDSGHAGAHLQAIRCGKNHAGYDLVFPGRAGIVAVQEEERVCDRHADGRQGHQPKGGGLAEPWHIARHVPNDSRLDAPDAGQGANLIGDTCRRTLETGKHISKTVADVVALLRNHQRLPGTLHPDQDGDATGNHECSGEHLPAQPPQVAPQHFRSRAHHDSSEGRARATWRSMPRIAPLLICTTRSAIAEIAALCVMTTVMAPSSRFTCSSTSSTSFPVL
ncbi:hypothetical protein D3C86_1262750 [compost metagenome]